MLKSEDFLESRGLKSESVEIRIEFAWLLLLEIISEKCKIESNSFALSEYLGRDTFEFSNYCIDERVVLKNSLNLFSLQMSFV